MSEKIDEIRRKMEAEKLTPEYKAFMEHSSKILDKAMIMKKNMKAKKLTWAKAKCPFCEGHWFATLNGRKEHIHMRCDGTCGTMMIE